MKVSDIDSIVHLLQSLAPSGMLFLVLIILPIYILGWVTLFKLLKLKVWHTIIGIILLGLLIARALFSLKGGIDEDQNLIARATMIKEIFITQCSDAMEFNDLKNYYGIPSDSVYMAALIRRFPESFCYTFPGRHKALQLIDSEALDKIDKRVEETVPIIYSELITALKKDSIKSNGDLSVKVDSRISYKVFERVITKYPENFIEISSNNPLTNYTTSFIKRIK